MRITQQHGQKYKPSNPKHKTEEDGNISMKWIFNSNKGAKDLDPIADELVDSLASNIRKRDDYIVECIPGSHSDGPIYTSNSIHISYSNSTRIGRISITTIESRDSNSIEVALSEHPK
ncbi:hypothetical protein [Rubritalea sp.]|uniref:hypothetical protein n=1 Tax=Rubritalea sp. TaxID=2109375 RepID=UPI003EF96BF3